MMPLNVVSFCVSRYVAVQSNSTDRFSGANRDSSSVTFGP